MRRPRKPVRPFDQIQLGFGIHLLDLFDERRGGFVDF
jgi:hypothetical protein